jgi:hypothetical protein
MKGVYFAMYFLAAVFSLLSLLTPRIPPLFGYFLCRTVLHDVVGTKQDICGLDTNDDVMVWLKMNGILIWLIRIVGSCASFVAFMSTVWNGVQVFMYEVVPGILFLKECIANLHYDITHIVGKMSKSSKHCIFTKYKEIILVNEMFNIIYERDFFYFVLGSTMAVLIPSGFVLITVININAILFGLFYLLVIFEYLIFLYLFTLAGNVCSRSVEFKSTMRRLSLVKRNSIERRNINAMQMLKIKVGGNNFIEKNTPFVFISFVIEQTVSLMLLMNQN